MTLDPYYHRCPLRNHLNQDSFHVTKYIVAAGSPLVNQWNAYVDELADEDEEEPHTWLLPEKDNYIYFATNTDRVYSNVLDLLKGTWLAFVHYAAGKVKLVKTASNININGEAVSAKECGMASVLSYLCLIDNQAPGLTVQDIHEINLVNGRHIYDPSDLDNVLAVLTRCQKLVFFGIAADPPIGARAYITAAIDAKFKYMVTIHICHRFCIHQGNKDPATCTSFVWKACTMNAMSTADPRMSFEQRNTNMRNLLNTFGTSWYFCLPLARYDQQLDMISDWQAM